MFVHLFRPASIKLTFRRLTTIFSALFHEEGSNARTFENMVYSEFLKYARESASKIILVNLFIFTLGILTAFSRGKTSEMYLLLKYIGFDCSDYEKCY